MKTKVHLLQIAGFIFLHGLILEAEANPAVVFTNLYSFYVTNGLGGNLYGGLVQGSDGYFYGATGSSVFKMCADGTLTPLHVFTNSDDGADIYGRLVQGRDGYLYGTTFDGGTNGAGTVFKISTNGDYTQLYSFTGTNDGANPQGSLVQGSDGYFYGTTRFGGMYTNLMGGLGTVFKITSNGLLTSLYSFAGTNGAHPFAGLLQGSDGYFYGTTIDGGTAYRGDITTFNPGPGTVFKIDTNGTLTTLYLFTGGNDGANPTAKLVQGSDGYFYGSTFGGGTNMWWGTVFKMSTNGALTSLYSFRAGDDGVGPFAELVQGSDGFFYGTTEYGGTNGYGTIFKITTNGVLTVLYFFTAGSDGLNPQDGLLLGSDGYFYGTTDYGGPGGVGIIFRLTILPRLTISSSGTNVILRWPTNATAYFLESATNRVPPVVWKTISASPVVINGQYLITIPISGAQMFFQLAQ